MKKKESALFFSYLCAHILQIAFLLLCFAIFAVILYLYDLPADPVLYAALLCAAVGLLSFILRAICSFISGFAGWNRRF